MESSGSEKYASVLSLFSSCCWRWMLEIVLIVCREREAVQLLLLDVSTVQLLLLPLLASSSSDPSYVVKQDELMGEVEPDSWEDRQLSDSFRAHRKSSSPVSVIGMSASSRLPSRWLKLVSGWSMLLDEVADDGVPISEDP